MSRRNALRRPHALLLPAMLMAASPAGLLADNKPERLRWFSDLGFGLFIHWSLDCQIGSVISHSMVGASKGYLERYVHDLPKTFDPKRYDPDEWASLAKLSGVQYIVFTTKHHSGFCMYDTDTTTFDIEHTPYGKDMTASLVKALRKRGLAVGFYFSPDDFHFLYKQGTTIRRRGEGVSTQDNPGLLEHDRAQLRELLTHYGPIDILFLDGPCHGLKELCWELQPDLVITRGAIQTPEQFVPGVGMEGPWETCMTMGTQWQYKPTHESYKSGTELIETLIKTRAKGGNLLLNVGPKPDGTIPIEQEARLREIALWMFVNGEAMHRVRPWVVTNEGDIWLTKQRDADTVYAIVTNIRWPWGKAKDLVLRSVRTTSESEVSVLGQTGKVLEYNPKARPQTIWRQADDGLHIKATRAQRLYNDRKWPNPVVLRITHAKPGLTPPRAKTGRARWDAASGTAILEGSLLDIGKAASVQVGFEVRLAPDHTEPQAKADPWKAASRQRREAKGTFRAQVAGLKKGRRYEFRAFVKHPLIAVYGDRVGFSTK